MSGTSLQDLIWVRESGGTYIARFRGKSASCTMGREAAAKAVARKVLGDTPHRVAMHAGSNTSVWEVWVTT